MNTDDLEFLISQYVDGTLDPEQAAGLEAVLRTDGEARAMLADHRRVTALLLDNTALPAIRFDRLAEVIASNIDQSEAQRVEQVYRFAFGRWAAGAAVVAACVLIGFVTLRNDGGVTTDIAGVVAAGGQRVVEIDGPRVELASAPRVVQVSIDSPMNAALVATLSWQDLSPAGARIVVSAGEPPAIPDALSGQ